MKKRLISAVLMLVITIPFLWIGDMPFTLFTLLIGELILFEFLKLRKKIPIFLKVISYILLGLIILKDLLNINLELIIILSDLIYLGSLIYTNVNNYNYKDSFLLIGLITFIGIVFSKIIYIRNNSLNELLYLIIIGIVSDTMAYLIGSNFGHRKLAPNISPNKTIEGLVGGVFFGTCLSSLFYTYFIGNYNNIFLIILITFILSVMGELGDLVKSCIKRYEGIKDFSNLIPGHGGLMDRLDSLTFITITYVIITSIVSI